MKNLSCFLLLITISITSSFCQTAHQFFTCDDGIKIAYTDEGNGTPVLLLHGFINDGSNWRKSTLAPMLTKKGFRVIVPDLRGNGLSDKPQEAEAYKNDVEVHDIMGLISYLKIDQYYAVGYSRGTIVLAKLLTKDTRISQAIMGGMGADFTNPNWDRRLMFAAAFNGDENAHPDTKGAIQYAKSIGADIVALGHQQRYQPVTSSEDIGKIKIPILVVAGADDKDNGQPSELAGMFANSQLKIVHGDHNNTYKTEDFANAVIHFFTSDH